MAVWSPAKDKGGIRKFGGGVIRLREVSDDGQTISATDTVYHDIGYLASTKFRDFTPLEDIADETGSVVASEEGQREVKLTGVLMQTDKEAFDIAKDTRRKFYRVYLYEGIVNNKHKEYFFGICRIAPMVDVDFPGGRTPFEISILRNTLLVTLSNAELNTIKIGGDAYPKTAHSGSETIVIPADDFYLIVETAVV
jgi:hypothetical protein